MQEQGMLATHFPESRTRRIRIGAIAALACVAVVAVVTRGLASSSQLEISLASSGSVQLCTDINFGGTCKTIGPGR